MRGERGGRNGREKEKEEQAFRYFYSITTKIIRMDFLAAGAREEWREEERMMQKTKTKEENQRRWNKTKEKRQRHIRVVRFGYYL